MTKVSKGNEGRYTIRLDSSSNETLVRMALLNGYRKDFADFAALVLREALDRLEEEYEREAAQAREAQRNAPRDGDLDDGIPF